MFPGDLPERCAIARTIFVVEMEQFAEGGNLSKNRMQWVL
jgi:hypothetical protein